MTLRWADFRFLLDRMQGLAHRTLTSVRQRGVGATWARVRQRLQPVPRGAPFVPYVPAARPFGPFRLRRDAQPRASIVIPVFNHVDHTLACLRALAEHPPAVAHEVIVVDDGSIDSTESTLRQVEGLRYHRRAANGGFIAACNDGAALASGEYLVLLNNDTVPQPGWLDALLATFRDHPGTGLAGACLLYPDGRLQEAGGLVFSDASGWNYGRFGAHDDPRYAFVRDADYCSGAAIALPRALFESLGGLDTRYSPAYYEDTDLAFAIRAQGLAVRYQPAARVLHDEGTSSGTDTSQGMKAYQVRNQGIFATKWAGALAAQPAPGGDPDRAAVRARRQVLIIDALTPDATRDSGSLRLLNLMRLLREEGAHVVFLPANFRHAGVATQALQQLGVEVWHAPFSGRAPRWLAAHGARFDTVIVCRHYVMREFLPLLRLHAPQARLVFDTVDLHYLRERRGAEVAGDAAGLRMAERTRAMELEMIARSDATLVVSAIERELLRSEAPGATVEILSNLHRVAGTGAAFVDRSDLVFVGGFRHPPNVDAMLWFCREAFPLIRARRPEIRLHCIGADAPEAITALASEPGILVHGHVPDLDPYMDGVRIALAPLRYGAGVKGKVNLSMAHGQPVVATRCAVEGMHLVDGHDVLVADVPTEFAEAVLRLYDDEALWNRLAANGLENIRAHFSLDAARDVVRRVILGERRKA